MGDAVIVDAVRTPFGRRDGALSGRHPATMLGELQRTLLERSGVEPGTVGQVVGGCVTQIGEQSFNTTRMAWLDAGLPTSVGASTVDVQCGSAQQAGHFVAAMIAADAIDVGVSCGVESMSRVPIGANTTEPGRPKPRGFPHDLPHQFVAAERIADRFGLGREDVDAYGARSQARAAAATAAGRHAEEIVSTPVRDRDPDAPRITADEGIRPTTRDGLAALTPIVDDGVHTAGTTSQISDGASAMLWMDRDRARAAGLRARARVRAQVLVGTDPHFHILGPLDATHALLDRARMTIGDIDLFEVNEAFAAVVLAWERTFECDPDRVNVNGGAIALGHPMGATGARLTAGVLLELERRDLTTALITMCCGGAVATGTIIERI